MNPDPNHESPGGDEFDALLLKLSLGDLTEDERARLEDGVRGDEALRQRYLEYIEIDAMLRWRANGNTTLAAAEAAAEAEAGSGQVPAPKPDGRRRRAGGRGRIAWIGAGIAAAAACAMIGFLDWGRDGGTDPVVAGGGAPEGAALAQAQSHPVERAMAKVQRAGDWLIRADADADFAVAGDGALNLVRGALYAERASGALADADAGSDTLTISTPAGTVTSRAGRFHLETLPIENQEPDPNMDTNANAKPNALTRLFVIAGSAILANAGAEAQTDPGEIAAAEQGQTPQKLQADGNYAEALAIYEKLLADPGHGGKAAADDLQSAFQCLNQLARYSAIDPLLEDAAKVHADDWRVLWRAATLYQNAPHYGSMIENEFARADQDQRGRRIDTSERDRIRALQLMAAAMPLAERVIGEDGAAVADFYADLGGLVTGGRQVWNWQYLTDFSRLPEYGDPTYWSSNGAPPVDEDGNAKFYEVPESWAAAANDGERWRWTLEQQKKADPTRALRVDYAYAYHLWQLFGVHTAGALGTPLLEDGEIMPEGRYTAHTLTKQETIARLATGVQRFALPAGHNFIERFEAVASAPLEEAPNPLRNLRFKLYEGDWDKLPDFAKLEPKAEGEVPSGTFDLELTDRREHFGFVFEGEIEIGEAGEFKFQIWSDDGSRLTIGDFVVDNDGLHGSGQSNTGTVKLEAGTHKIRAEFFEKTGEETFIAQCWGPGMEEGAYLSRMRHGTLPQEDALTQLAQLHENRQQFENAADYWRRSIAQFGAGPSFWKRDRLEQITLPWARMESAHLYTKGDPVDLPVTFRNAAQIDFTATAVDYEAWIAAVKAYLKSDPVQVNDPRAQFGNLAGQLLGGDGAKYLKAEKVEWSEKVDPAPDHWSRRIAVKAPLPGTGAYWIKAQAMDGNATYQLVWVADTAIVFKNGNDEHQYFIADASSGAPLDGANLEVFGMRTTYDGGKRRHFTKTVNFSRLSGEDGIAAYGENLLPENFQRLAIARTADGRFGILGDFMGDGYNKLHSDPRQAAKAWVTTDRPVYRPDQQVYMKAWVRQADYTAGDVSAFGGREVELRLFSPDGQKMLEKKLTADAFGGIVFDTKLEPAAMLGVYRWDVVLRNYKHPANSRAIDQFRAGMGTFRVEEYKKPEFEVTVEGPSEPVKLGETIEATIKAKYFFGEPVANAQVKYTVKRKNDMVSWFPGRPWDWFYGERYWWWGYDYDWYPGFRGWCIPPIGWAQPGPDEVIAENTVPIEPDGTVKVKIDTAPALERWPDGDHRYTIEAEVVDESRRTITGTGSALAAREPFRVYAWVNGGHFRQGDQIGASFHTQTPDGKPVPGMGKAALYRVTYADDGTPTETAVQEWDAEAGADGNGKLDIKAAAPGQYRLAVTIADAKGQSQTGAALIRVLGPDGAPAPADGSFRFADLEIVPDKAEYAPGDKVRLLINADHGGTVALFIRPVNGLAPRPEIIDLGEAKSAVREIEVGAADYPNFNVEAFTIHGGQIFTAFRSIAVPPQERMLTLEVEPGGEKFEPGEKAKVKLRLLDAEGKPFAGSTVVTVYDKSLESIAANSTAEIRAFFWKWIRSHYVNYRTNLGGYSYPLVRNGEKSMADLGAQYYYGYARDYGVYGGGRSWGGVTRFDIGLNQEGSAFGSRRGLGMVDSLQTTTAAAAMPLASAADEFAGGIVEKRRQFAPMAQSRAQGMLGKMAGEGGQGGPPEIAVRSKFADTAFWSARLDTDEKGEAEIEIDMPENLTAWKINAWAMGHGTRVGHGEAEVVTSKDVLVRLQAPRFFTERDEVALSANVHNYTGEARDIEVSLALEGDVLAALDGIDLTKTLRVEPNGDQRADWRVKAVAPGEALVRVKAVAGGPGGKGDAMEQRFPVIVRGALRTESWSLALRDKDSGSIEFIVPEDRRPEQSHLEIRYSPSIALALVDALPYLAGYPYKNSEAATSRLHAFAAVQRILKETGVDLAAVKDKMANLNPQEIGDPNQRAAQWKRHDDTNPIYDNAQTKALVESALRDITGLQNPDGGWGWFTGETSYAHMTAYVVHSLKQAELGGVALVPGVKDRGVNWLENFANREAQKLANAERQIHPWKSKADNLDAFAFMVLAENGKKHDAMLSFLYRDRLDLSPYAQAMFGVACDMVGDREKRDMVARNLAQFRVDDPENQSSFLRLPNQGWWWYWYGDEGEANAYYLRLLTRIDPKGAAAAGVAKYLLNNRKHGTHWHSTRCTAASLGALAEFAIASGEANPDLEIEVLVDGESKRKLRVTKDNLFAFDNVLEFSGSEVKGGKHTVEFRRHGAGPLYANVYLTNFSLEDKIGKAGLEIKVERRYYKLEEQRLDIKAAGSKGQVLDYRTTTYKRTPIKEGDELKSGDKVEVELLIDSKNDYEYLQFADPKPAGMEAAEVQSGYRWLGGVGAYMELRDQKVEFFIRNLHRGKHSLTYQLRAEIPGTFTALPARGDGVYAPELRANSESFQIGIGEHE